MVERLKVEESALEAPGSKKKFEEYTKGEHELEIRSHVYEALRGEVVEDKDNDGNTIHLVKNGSGMFGLKSMEDNIGWAGIIHHSALTGRIAAHVLIELQKKGEATNPKGVFETMFFSHAGRRQWENARDYPEQTARLAGSKKEAERRREDSNEATGLRIIKKIVPPDQYDLVAAMAQDEQVSPEIYNTQEYKVYSVVDHRTADRYMSLKDRMAGFFMDYFHFEGENSEDIKKAKETKKAQVVEKLGEIINIRIKALLEDTKDNITLEQAIKRIADLGISEDETKRKGATINNIMNYILKDSDEDAYLKSMGIETDAINDDTVPMPDAEDDFRREYAYAAKDEVLASIKEKMQKGQDDIDQVLDTLVPKNKWLIKYFKEIYMDSEKHPAEGSSGVIFQAPTSN